jgi:hypothetical protein
MLDDHSKLVPLLPIPNRTVKRLSADDSAGSRVKVGHRQALMPKTPTQLSGRFLFQNCKVLNNMDLPRLHGISLYNRYAEDNIEATVTI